MSPGSNCGKSACGLGTLRKGASEWIGVLTEEEMSLGGRLVNQPAASSSEAEDNCSSHSEVGPSETFEVT